MVHSEAYFKFQIKFENQINILLLIREMDKIQSARQHVVHLCSNGHNTRENSCHGYISFANCKKELF